jgi:uracil-DNA glycosylase family 4
VGADQHQDWDAIARSAVDWWRDAGLEVLVGEEPRDWRAKERPAAPLAAEALPTATAATLPTTLDAFLAWRTGPDAPERAWSQRLLPPEGLATAPIMVVIDCPDDQALLDGAAGRLFDRMLAAIQLDRARIHLAALSCARPMGGRIPPEVMPRLVELMRRHIALAAPQRVLVLGTAASRALVAAGDGNSAGSLGRINLEDGMVPAVASCHPRSLIETPKLKAVAWRDLQALVGG